MALDGLATLAQRPPANGSSTRCDTCWLIGELPPTDAANLEAALGNPAVKYVEIIDQLTRAGYPIGDSSIRRHARGRCEARKVYRGGNA